MEVVKSQVEFEVANGLGLDAFNFGMYDEICFG
jgi:hypothetical protein